MSNFALEIFDDEGSKCIFYTVLIDGEEKSEVEKFFIKFYNIPEMKMYASELARFLTNTIGEKKGAIDAYFREEKNAHAVPPYPSVEIEEISILDFFPLRLYCLRISSSCVILFNGGEKTSRTAQGGATSMSFHDANIFAEKILKAFANNEIKLCEKEREILDYFEKTKITEILF
ncbi:hypothetical protein [Chryseobacterium sp. Leaf201]|uniref:hypothetical protein n=1 Tax=Chryseobacterium sp. Leaf201 TaxID=1735672 RepID=UPI00070132F1|nr:hypothetical protein [Chryseobacterium sp. Leaf201]KQM36465.1 hypothetical protein ASE55_03915 [Chryseobacterium sp. Leaf201]